MTRLLQTVLCWLALCAPAFAAGEFQLLDKSLSGQTLYILLFSGAGEADAGEAWDGDSWEPLTNTWASFDVAMTEVTTTGNFLGTMPAIGDKNVRWVIYQDANDDATPDATTDIALADGEGFWSTTDFGSSIDLEEILQLVSSLLPPGNVPDRTWAMRRTATLVGSNVKRYKSNDETITMWADVSRLLGENEEIGDVADIDVTASGVTITGMGKQGDMIYATFAGGTVDEDAVTVTWEFETDSGTPIVATSPLVIID